MAKKTQPLKRKKTRILVNPNYKHSWIEVPFSISWTIENPGAAASAWAASGFLYTKSSRFGAVLVFATLVSFWKINFAIKAEKKDMKPKNHIYNFMVPIRE